MSYKNQKQDEFYKLVDKTYTYLGIQNDGIAVKTEPDKGNLIQDNTLVYSSDRAEGYLSQRILINMAKN